MSANHLWTPTRVQNFMRELEMNDTNWDENIVALAEKGSMSVEEFLQTDPITFGEKIWGKDDWKCISTYPRVKKILGDSIYHEMLAHYYQMQHYHYKTPAQRAVKAYEEAYEDAKVAAIKEQKALGLTTYMGVSAQDKTGWEYVFAENKAAKAAAAVKAATAQLAVVNEAEKVAGVCQDGWHAAALEHANALFNLKEADTALRQKAAAAAAEAAAKAAAAKVAAEAAELEHYYLEKRAAKGPSVTLEDTKRIVGDRTDMTTDEVLNIIWAQQRVAYKKVMDAVAKNEAKLAEKLIAAAAEAAEAAELEHYYLEKCAALEITFAKKD